jgi:menaquinone-specific isochorismate synthase
VQHLLTAIRAERKSGVSDADIITALHPTPAVGGLPRGPALVMLRMLEPYERGWYASPIGISSSSFADIAVGIRSAVVSGNELYMFCGAGIVRGSEPDAEWRELDNKDILANLVAER